MAPFKFPPPPPPPPKAPSSDAQNAYSSQRGGPDSGRGDRGRGRGGQGRGRGSFQGNTRGGYGQGDRTGNAPSRGGPRGGHQQPGRGGWQDRNQNQNYVRGSSQQHVQQLSSQIAPPFNTNVASVSPPLSGVPAPQANGTTLVQAMSFMSTPAGMQSMAAFANHMAGTNNASIHAQLPSPQQWSPKSHQSPPTSLAKRKRDERAIHWQSPHKQQPPKSAQQQGQKPPRAKAATAPALPSFGFSLSSAPTPLSLNSKRDGQNDQKRRKVNMGLTRHEDEVSESSSEEDNDEEATFASNDKLKNGVVFEHGGESISLQTPAEIAAWIKDRRRQFPTQKRVAEKAQEAAGKRASELEFLRKLTGKPKRQDPDPPKLAAAKRQRSEQESRPSAAKPNADSEKTRKSFEHRTAMSEEVPTRQRAQQASAATAATAGAATTKPSAIDLGLGYASETDSNQADSSDLSDSSVLSDSEDSSSDSDSDDDNAPPEAASSKTAIAPVVAPPPPPVAAKPQQKKKQPDVCPQWKKTGRCKYSNHCRYPHPAKDEPKLVGLYDRMVEQELEKADQLALDAIKYLGQNGFLG